jgi:hypothetical protein
VTATDPFADGIKIRITVEDWEEGRRLGLTGVEVVARAIRRENPEVTNVQFSADGSEFTVTVGGKPLH